MCWAQNGAAVDEKYYSKSFQFLSLGAMAYIGELDTFWSLVWLRCSAFCVALLHTHALKFCMKALRHCCGTT